MALMDDAMALSLGLSEDDSVYDLTFISKKLAICATYQERLSDIMMKLTMRSIEVHRVSSGQRRLLEMKERELKEGVEYAALAREEKGPWLGKNLQERRDEAERWNTLKRVVLEVKEAVSERAQMMKRLDSDLRLHSKLYEAKVAAGATSRRSFTGTDHSGLSI